jgi:hypothetical protein
MEPQENTPILDLPSLSKVNKHHRTGSGQSLQITSDLISGHKFNEIKCLNEPPIKDIS